MVGGDREHVPDLPPLDAREDDAVLLEGPSRVILVKSVTLLSC